MPTDISKIRKTISKLSLTCSQLSPTLSPHALSSTIFITGTRPGHHSLLFLTLCPMSRQVPSLDSSLLSYSVGADSPQIIGPQFWQGSPTLPTAAQLLTKLSSTLPHSHDLLSSVPIYCPAFLRTTPYTPNSTGAKSGSLEGDLFLIEEELVEKNRNSQQMLTGIPSAALALPRKCLSQL